MSQEFWTSPRVVGSLLVASNLILLTGLAVISLLAFSLLVFSWAVATVEGSFQSSVRVWAAPASQPGSAIRPPVPPWSTELFSYSRGLPS